MSITLDQAQTLIGGALAEARKLNLKPVSVIVLDIRGSIVAAASEDGVSAMRARIAHGKANAAIALGMGTRALMNRAEQQAYFIQSINGLAGGDMVPVPGGVLVRDASGGLLGQWGSLAIPPTMMNRQHWAVLLLQALRPKRVDGL